MKAEDEVFKKLKLILSQKFKINEDLIAKNAKLADDLGLDSIELMDAIGFAESQFKINILKGSMNGTQFPVSVGDLTVLIEKKIKEAVSR